MKEHKITETLKKSEKTIQNSLATKTDAEILSKHYDSPEFIAPGLLSFGLSILAAKPKSGKSLMAMDLANSIANGSRFLGRFDLSEHGVLYLALEDTEPRLQTRLKKISEDPNGTGKFHFATECCRLDQGFFEHIEKFMAEKQEVKLIIIDTFNKVRRFKRRGTTPYEKDYNEINELKKFADDHKMAIMVIHHLRKSEAKDITDTISGSTGITAAADAIFILQKERGSNLANFYVTGRDISDFEIGLTLNQESLCWEIATPTDEMTKERAEILSVLEKANGPMKLGKIAEIVNKKKNNVHKLIAGLIVAGKVEKPDYGIYQLKKESSDNGQNSGESGESGESTEIAA